MSKPPTSSSEETPKEPNDSNFPYPSGKRSVGGRNAKDTVAKVKKSDTRSVRLCTASAVKAASADQYRGLSRCGAHVSCIASAKRQDDIP
jgi:hypothetical protein